MRAKFKLNYLLSFAIVFSLCIPFISPLVDAATKVDLEQSGKGDTWVQLSWSRSDDGDNFLKYEIYAGKKGQGFSLRGTIDDIDKTNFKVSGLEKNTKYQFKIRDIDKDGYEQDSDHIEVETTPDFDVVVFVIGIAVAVLCIGIYRRYYRTQDE